MKVKVKLQPIINNINVPTAIKTAILPGESVERLFVATQAGEIFYTNNNNTEIFLDIRKQIIELKEHDERGLIGLAFHPQFNYNGLFYIHYSVAGTQGKGALSKSFRPDPCDTKTLNLKWTDRENLYDHIDTIEEWILKPNSVPQKQRTLLNLRRPFASHNGFNSLNFSPETGKLFLTLGDGGSAFDPFNLSQNDMEIAGKIIEIDVDNNSFNGNPPMVSRFNELPLSIQETLTLIAKGIRNISGISFQKFYNQYIKYIGNVGQELVESIFAFTNYKPIPVAQLTQASSNFNHNEFINFGWRGWEGVFPTSIVRKCPKDHTIREQVITYYDEAIKTSTLRLQPLISYFHKEVRANKFRATAITGVQPYMGNEIPDLTGNVIFIDLVKKGTPSRGILAYTKTQTDCNINDFDIIEVDYDFGSKPTYYTSLGTNINQTKLYLGVNNSIKTTDHNQSTIFEIIP